MAPGGSLPLKAIPKGERTCCRLVPGFRDGGKVCTRYLHPFGALPPAQAQNVRSWMEDLKSHPWGSPPKPTDLQALVRMLRVVEPVEHHPFLGPRDVFPDPDGIAPRSTARLCPADGDRVRCPVPWGAPGSGNPTDYLNPSSTKPGEPYFRQDAVEKVFRVGKEELSWGPIRFRRKGRTEAYATLFYTAYLPWSWAERRLQARFP